VCYDNPTPADRSTRLPTPTGRQDPMSLKYEPSSEPLHICVKKLFSLSLSHCDQSSAVGVYAASRCATTTLRL